MARTNGNVSNAPQTDRNPARDDSAAPTPGARAERVGDPLATADDADQEAAQQSPGRRRKGLRREIHLPLWVVVSLHVVGWLLVVFGLLGLFLPVLQGILFLLAGFAVLSIASETFHGFLRERFRRYPRGWRQLQRLRRAVEKRLPRRRQHPPAAPSEPDR